MENIQIITLCVSALTLIVSFTSAILTYKLAKQKKRIERLEKYYTIALENLQANYEIEEYLAQQLGKTRLQLQNELREWMKERNIELKREFYRPSFFKTELTYLRK